MVVIRPWTKSARSGFEVDIRIEFPDRTKLRERVRAKVKTKAEAERWGRQREIELITRGKPPPAVSPAAPAPQPSGEAADKWHERYLAHCKARGVVTTGDKGYRWSKWVAPTIGQRAIADVTKDDVEAIRDVLDRAILDGRISAKTAQNAWGELTVSFGEACSSKRKDLRVRRDNPCLGVQPPETGVCKSKVYPYPAELLALVSCALVPLEWREIHAVAAYTYLRPGELWVLDWSDVDLDDQTIHVTHAWDFKNRRIKGTKTHETRSIPIEPALLPLLKGMHKRAGGNGLVVPALSLTNPDQLARFTREHFELAKCTRPRLTKNTKTERHVVFRSWRDAGITWAIVRGDDLVRVQRRAGHKLISTTQRYIVEAENRGATFGVPFPELPASLLDGRGELLENSSAEITIEPVSR